MWGDVLKYALKSLTVRCGIPYDRSPFSNEVRPFTMEQTEAGYQKQEFRHEQGISQRRST